ncbi:hypothetical protein [Rhizobium aegyptiacum]|uniref:hypothetical protein n=1 Tax=Rhizobium aegyptiacum TaxID=1764550 RepID=UPI0007E5499D|nr:hypothetical protein [Rhizobium aegyptiacum]
MKTPAKKVKQPVTHPTEYRTIAALPGYLFGDDGCIVSTRLLKEADVIAFPTENSFRIRIGSKKDAPRIERIKHSVYQGHVSANLRIARADGQSVPKSFQVAALMCMAWHGERPAPKARAEIIDTAATITPANVHWAIPDPSAGPVRRGPRAATIVRNAELVALHKQGLRDAEIAKRTGIPLSTVSRSIAPHRQTIRPRDIGSKLDLAHVLRLYAQNKTQADIARQLKVNRKVINKLIAKARRQGLFHLALAEPEACD